ncbi:hypothetical protein ACRJ4W_07355 [Streptomyces sp. GLT-R25]
MCVRVTFVPPDHAPTFDAEARALVVPRGLSPARTVTLVRAILSELVVEQPALGAVCWCGAPVDLTPRIPIQRRSDEQVVKHGA